MANSFRLSGGIFGGGRLRFAAIPLLLAVGQVILAPGQPAIGQEYDDVFDVVALNEDEHPALKIQQPAESVAADDAAESDKPSVQEQFEAAEKELLDAPCDSNSGECYCSSNPGLKERLEACMKSMEAQGLKYDFINANFYQGVTHGGQDEEFEFGGKVDQYFILDGGKLWGMEGFSVTMHVETRYGEDVNREAVGLAPVNIAMLMPKSDEHDTAITNLTFQQALSEEWLVAFGKFNAIDMWQGLYPQSGRGVDGFMQSSIVFPLGGARVVPLSFMGVGVTRLYEGKPQVGLTVFDNQDVSTTSGFDDMFQNGANILAFYRHFHEMNGLPGSQLFGGVWATGEYVSFDPISFVILPGQGVVIDRQGGAYTLLYILDQTLWADPCNKTRNVNLLSQWALSDQDTSPFHWTCNVAIQGTGMIGSRPNDTIGIGYFHSQLSDSFVNALSPVFDLGNVDGVELYYKVPVGKAAHVTADLQVIEPAEEELNTAVVVGLRGVVGF
jgi:porin